MQATKDCKNKLKVFPFRILLLNLTWAALGSKGAIQNNIQKRLQEEGCKEETCYKENKLTEMACVVSGGGTIVSWELEMYDFLDGCKNMIGHDERVWIGGEKTRPRWEEEFTGVFESHDMGDYDVCRHNQEH